MTANVVHIATAMAGSFADAQVISVFVDVTMKNASVAKDVTGMKTTKTSARIEQ